MSATQSMPQMKNRREILRGALRCGGLAALGGIGSVLAWRSLRGDCVRKNPCGGCPLFTGCDLPKAINSKQINPKPASDHA